MFPLLNTINVCRQRKRVRDKALAERLCCIDKRGRGRPFVIDRRDQCPPVVHWEAHGEVLHKWMGVVSQLPGHWLVLGLVPLIPIKAGDSKSVLSFYLWFFFSHSWYVSCFFKPLHLFSSFLPLWVVAVVGFHEVRTLWSAWRSPHQQEVVEFSCRNPTVVPKWYCCSFPPVWNRGQMHLRLLSFRWDMFSICLCTCVVVIL